MSPNEVSEFVGRQVARTGHRDLVTVLVTRREGHHAMHQKMHKSCQLDVFDYVL